MARNILSILLIAVVVIMSSSCSDSGNDIMGNGTASIRITVKDDSILSSRMIEPENLLNYSTTHYKFYLFRGESSDIDASHTDSAFFSSDGYTEKGESFTVTGIVTGYYWRAKVEAYINTDRNVYTKIGEGTSDAFPVFGSSDVPVDVSVVLDDALSGDITITLLLPIGVSAITSLGYIIDSGSSVMLDASNIQTAQDDSTGFFSEVEFIIDADAAGREMYQGVHTIEIEFTGKSSTDEVISRTGIDSLRLISGLSASGTIDLRNTIVENPGFDVSDETGDRINDDIWYEIKDIGSNKNVIMLYSSLFLDETNASYSVYVDGIQRSPDAESESVIQPDGNTGDEGINAGVLSFNDILPEGSHILNVLVSDGTALGAGSYRTAILIENGIWVKPSGADGLVKMEQ